MCFACVPTLLTSHKLCANLHVCRFCMRHTQVANTIKLLCMTLQQHGVPLDLER